MEIGTDIIEIKRIKEAADRHKKFPARILTEKELSLYNSYPAKRQATYLAGRFAAKEAYVKALGTGIGRITFTDIEILPDEKGKPSFTKGPIIQQAKVSISHSHENAIAMVIIELTEPEINEFCQVFIENKHV